MQMRILRQMRTLVRNGNRLLEPDPRERVIMHSRELPTCLVKQVMKMGNSAFLAVEQSHHLRRVKKTSVESSWFEVRSFLPSCLHGTSPRSRDQD
jgi:hypothetical protein